MDDDDDVPILSLQKPFSQRAGKAPSLSSTPNSDTSHSTTTVAWENLTHTVSESVNAASVSGFEQVGRANHAPFASSAEPHNAARKRRQKVQEQLADSGLNSTDDDIPIRRTVRTKRTVVASSIAPPRNFHLRRSPETEYKGQSKTDSNTVSPSLLTEEEGDSKTLAYSRFKDGQKFPCPPIGDGTRAFYESLLKERPDSVLAIKYCIEHGVLIGTQHKQKLAQYYKLKESGAFKGAVGGIKTIQMEPPSGSTRQTTTNTPQPKNPKSIIMVGDTSVVDGVESQVKQRSSSKVKKPEGAARPVRSKKSSDLLVNA